MKPLALINEVEVFGLYVVKGADSFLFDLCVIKGSPHEIHAKKLMNNGKGLCIAEMNQEVTNSENSYLK